VGRIGERRKMFTSLGHVGSEDSVEGDGRKGGARMGKTIGRKQGEEDVKS